MDQSKSVNSQSLFSRRNNANQYRNQNNQYMSQRAGNTYVNANQPNVSQQGINNQTSNFQDLSVDNEIEYQEQANPYHQITEPENQPISLNQGSENPKGNNSLDNMEVVDGTPIIKLGGQNMYEPDTRMANYYHGYEDDYVHIDSISQYDRRRGYRRKYCSDKSYPSIHIEEENNELGTMLLDCYAAELSELSFVTYYSYLNIVIDNQYEEIKEVYRGLSIVELHHLNIIGELIKQLGVMPRYYHKNKNNITMWTGNYIPGKFDMQSALLDSIKNEKDMIIKYKTIIETTDNSVIKEVLSRIILDEEIHVTLLEELQSKYLDIK